MLVRPEIMERAKENRLTFFETQIAETQLNILILEKNLTAYNNQAADAAQLAGEQAKLEKLEMNYTVVKELQIHDPSTPTA